MQDDVSRIAGQRPAQRLLPVEKLTVFPEVQRIPPTKKLVKEIADKMDLSALGCFHVSQRANGDMSVMDGQRRMLALRMLKLHSYRVNALVYTGLTIAQEAAMFRLLNHSRLVGAFDDFDKGVVAGDPRDVGIKNTLEKFRWQIARGPRPGVAACVTALRNVWDHDGNGALLARTVRVLDAAFGRDKNTMASSLVAGMGKFLAKDGVDNEVLVDKLKAKFAAPVSVVTQARTHQEINGGSLSNSVASIIERTYNARRRGTK